MAQYRLNDPRHGVIGPVRLETARDLVAAGVIQDDVLVSRDGGPWRPVGELRELFGEPRGREAPKPTYAGDLRKNSFFKVFYRFHLAGATGLLTVRDPPRRKDIYVEAGQPVYVSSNVEGERLGDWLRRRGRIDPEDLRVAIASMATDNNRLGATLVRLGLMDPQEVVAALVGQQRERLVDLCRWGAGTYEFFEGARYLGEKMDLALSANDLILAAARSMDEEMLADRLRPHVSDFVRRERHPELDTGAFALTTTERRALGSVDGFSTLGDLVRQFADPEARRAAFVVLYLAWEIDALSFHRPR